MKKRKLDLNPSVVLHFRVKVNSPLYTWLNQKAEIAGSLSEVIRDIMEHHRLNVVDLEHFKAIKRNAELYHCLKDYIRGTGHRTENSRVWDNFWTWMKKEHSDIYKV